MLFKLGERVGSYGHAGGGLVPQVVVVLLLRRGVGVVVDGPGQ